jgi:LysM repeat protein
MKLNKKIENLVAAMVGCGVMGLAGCAGSKTMKPESTPVVAATTAVATVEPTPAPKQQRYSVKKGNTLWGISGIQEIYGENFQWPLIFKANRDQIQDPDIIEVGQNLVISKEFSQNDVVQAIEDAKKTPQYKKHIKPRTRLPIEY